MYAVDGYVRPNDPAGLVHIGWLERGRDFRRGEVTREFFDKLLELARDPFEPFITMGFHRCDFHQFTSGPHELTLDGKTAGALFRSNLFIPDGRRIFYAPSAIAHYIDAYFYRPPDDFIAAVTQCPPVHSMEFKRLFLASGGRALNR